MSRPSARQIPLAKLAFGLVFGAGVGLRVVAAASWWPATTTLADSWPYAAYAEGNPLTDPQHPAGYSTMLKLIGLFTRQLAVPIVLQHLLGLAAALMLYGAVRRITGSPWPALVPAAFVLLNSDQIFLEHTIMSEGPFVAALAGTLYAAVRAVDEPDPWWRWPLATAGLAVLATVIRSVGVFLVPVIVVALLVSKPRPWRPRWRAPVALGAAAGVLLAGYALANLAANGRFEPTPAQGWHLYGRAAPFADCRQFTPPRGTEALCETTPVVERPGGDFYLYDPASPALELYGPTPWKDHDGDLGAFARAAILHQPLDYLSAMKEDLVAYFVPSTYVYRWGRGWHLDPQLDWTASGPGYDESVRDTEEGMQQFFDLFDTKRSDGGRRFLHDYGRVFRFGATMLTLTMLVTLVGLVVGPRRARVGALLFGIGGLALLVAPTVSVYYTGRYTVPVGGPLAAGAAITIWSVWRMERARRRVESAAAPSLATARSDFDDPMPSAGGDDSDRDAPPSDVTSGRPSPSAV